MFPCQTLRIARRPAAAMPRYCLAMLLPGPAMVPAWPCNAVAWALQLLQWPSNAMSCNAAAWPLQLPLQRCCHAT